MLRTGITGQCMLLSHLPPSELNSVRLLHVCGLACHKYDCTVDLEKSKECVPSRKPDKSRKMKVHGKRALVLGGTGAIGICAAHELIRNGAKHVMIAAKEESRGRIHARRLEATFGSGRASFVSCDLYDKKQTKRAMDYIEDSLEQLDICVNCIGSWRAPSVSAEKQLGKNWQNELKIDLNGALRGSLMAHTLMSKTGGYGGNGGCLIHICGTMGVEPFSGASVLTAGKHTGVGFCTSLGTEEQVKASGVRLAALCPGMTTNRPGELIERLRQIYSPPAMSHILEREIGSSQIQRPDTCGKAILHLITYAPSGTIWVIEGTQLFELQIPKQHSYSKLIRTII